jgi:hypothetical protein
LPIGSQYASLGDVVQGFAQLEHAFRNRHDRRAIFVTAYLSITLEIERRLEAGLFLDRAWVAQYVVAFANLYRQALVAFEQGDLESVPKSWRIAFETAVNNAGTVLQDLVLGINAHINHDLPLALIAVSIDPERARRYSDHTAVNEALRAATKPIEDRISAVYAPVLSVLSEVLGSVIEDLTSFSFVKARENAWLTAVTLVNAQDDPERAALRARLNDQAAVLARLILSPTAISPELLSALRHVEQVVPWWGYITLAEVDQGGSGGRAEEPLLVNTLDELLGALGEIVKRYDSRRSKMSIYPSVYLMFTHKVKQAMAQGDLFEDSAWVTRLDLHFATQYLRALAAFEAGTLSAVPDCWATTFQATAADQLIIVQALTLAVNARLNHDLPIALLQAGLELEDAELLAKRRRDLEKMHVIFQAEIRPVLDLLAEKYSHFLTFVNFIGGDLEALVADFSYTRARDAAWNNGVALAGAASPEQRQRMLQDIDKRTTELAQQILLRNIIGASWVVQALRYVENTFAGSWSELIRGSDASAEPPA